MFNQNELIQTLPPQFDATSERSNAVDSIFIVKSLLTAIIRDYLLSSDEAAVAVSKLRQEITILLAEDNISYSYFSYVDTQLYLLLSMLKGYHRLAMLILNEKRHIDIAIGDAIKTQENYQKIFRIYVNILEGIHANNYNAASNALGELSKTLVALTLKV